MDRMAVRAGRLPARTAIFISTEVPWAHMSRRLPARRTAAHAAGFPRRAGCGAAGDRAVGDPRFHSRHRVGLRDRHRDVADAEALRIAPAVPQPPDAHRARHHGGDLVAGRAAGGRRGDPGDRLRARPARVAAHDPGQRHPGAGRGRPAALRRGADHRMVAGQPRPSAACGHRDARRQQREIPRVRPAVRHQARARAARIRLHARHAVRDPARRPQAVGGAAAGARRAFGAAARS